MKEYGTADSLFKIQLTYINNDPSKLKEGIQLTSDTPSGKYLILYNSANIPVGFENYSSNNTLQAKGAFFTDAAGRIIKVIRMETNGDTSGITTLFYGSNEYFRPQVVHYFNNFNKRNEFIEYLDYDSHGNMVSAEGYRDNGSGFFKYSEIKATGYGKVINPLNCIFTLLLSSYNNYGLGSSSAILCSYFMPESVSEEIFLSNGDRDRFTYTNYSLVADGDNYLTKATIDSPTDNSVVVIKY